MGSVCSILGKHKLDEMSKKKSWPKKFCIIYVARTFDGDVYLVAGRARKQQGQMWFAKV